MSSPDCPDCGADSVAVAVPESLADYADGPAVALCSRCLRTRAVEDGAAEPTFDAVVGAFPDGEAGVAVALALGKLGSLALNRTEIVALCEHAERAGADVLLTLDRLAAAGSVEPHFDIDRRRSQLRDFLDAAESA